MGETPPFLGKISKKSHFLMKKTLILWYFMIKTLLDWVRPPPLLAKKSQFFSVNEILDSARPPPVGKTKKKSFFYASPNSFQICGWKVKYCAKTVLWWSYLQFQMIVLDFIRDAKSHLNITDAKLDPQKTQNSLIPGALDSGNKFDKRGISAHIHCSLNYRKV